MRIDHVIIGARNLDEIRDLLYDGYGFGLVQGSSHPDGTAGWLVPFDTPDVQYLEVLLPDDEHRLAQDPFGRHFLDATAAGPAFLTWALHSDAIDQDAARVAELTGADPELLRGESVRADGQRSPWAEAAFELSWTSPSRPFFLSYGNWTARRARVPGDLAKAGHRVTPLTYAGISVGTAGAGDLDGWLGGADLPVERRPADGESVQAVRIRTDSQVVEMALPC